MSGGFVVFGGGGSGGGGGISYSEVDAGVTGAAKTITLVDGVLKFCTVDTNNAVITVSGGTVGGAYDLLVCQDATGGKAYTLSGVIYENAGISPTTSTLARRVDHYRIVRSASGYRVTYVLNGLDARYPFDPTQVSGLKFWIDATDAASITQSGGKVSAWNDKSATGANGTQATGSAQPAYTANNSQLNNLPTISFNGSTHWMDFGATALLQTGQAYTIFLVMNAGAALGPSSWPCLMQFANSSAEGVMIEAQTAAGAPTYNDIHWGSHSTWTVARMASINAWASLPKKILFEFDYNGSGATTIANFTGRYQAAPATVTAAGTLGATLPSKTTLGAAYTTSASGFSQIDIGELIIYNGAITTAQHDLVQGYLTSKWGGFS